MRHLLAIAMLILLLSSCTKMDVDTHNLPDVNSISPTTINTSFCVANLEADPQEFASMYRRYSGDIVISGKLSFYNEEKQQKLSQYPVHIEIKGNASAKYVMKSLGVLFEKPLNNDSARIFLPDNLINGHSISTLHSIRFRNGGQDFGRTMIKDIAYTELAIQAGLDVELMYYKPVHVFVNGKYFGLTNMRTENEEFGIAGLLNTSVSGITTMDTQTSDAEFEWETGPVAPSDALLAAIENEDADEILKLMDISSYLDYLIYEDYAGNRDWPNNNLRLYSNNGQPFRFMLYDMDYAADRPKDPKLPEMENGEGGMAQIYQTLKTKPEFYQALRDRQVELYNTFTQDHFNMIIEKLASDIEQDIPYLIAKYNQPASVLQWQQYLEILKREFKTQDEHIRKKHDLD